MAELLGTAGLLARRQDVWWGNGGNATSVMLSGVFGRKVIDRRLVCIDNENRERQKKREGERERETAVTQ